MVRKLTKSVLITIVVLVVITGIVVGILFGVGILKTHKSGSSGGGSTPVGPHPVPVPPGPFNPVVNCEQMPVVKSFNRMQDTGNFRLTFTPISENCISSKTWYYAIQATSSPTGWTSGVIIGFNPSAGQSFIDIPRNTLQPDPHSPVKSLDGLVWLRTVNADGSGDLQQSNQLPFVLTDI